ncbi:MAG: hypothetical protein ABSC33_04740 [Candidatus Sulfotelmatobacter sp.]
MAASRRKLISDLPRFSVGAVRGYEDEHATIEVTGQFDRPEAVREGMCWLLLPDKENYYGELFSFKLETKIGKFRTHVKSPPRFDGRTFYHLSAYWQAYHVWMVMDASLSWQKLIFQSFDAVSDRIEAATGKDLRGSEKPHPRTCAIPSSTSCNAVGIMSIASCATRTLIPEIAVITVTRVIGYVNVAITNMFSLTICHL